MAELRCRSCGATYALGNYPRGCPACALQGKLGLLEVTYRYDGETRRQLEVALAQRTSRPLWRFDALLPLSARETSPMTLGEGGTPLLEGDWLDPPAGVRLLLKNETANPTWCSKDRVNTVNATVAKHLSARGLVATTTGNHGTSVVAYGARAGLPAVALCLPSSDIIHRAMIASYGGTCIVAEDRERLLDHLVHAQGWFGASSMDDPLAPNPYGLEGNKSLAFELFAELQEVPDAVLAPTASGDLLYGVYKGFRELTMLGLATRLPRMVACQAAGAAALEQALRQGLAEVPVLPHPATVALSVGDATSGAHALEAVKATGGDVIAVSDQEILHAQRQLGAGGLLVEAASATTLAALPQAVQRGALRRGERVVCLLTGAAIKWSTQLLSGAMGRVWVEPTIAQAATLAGAAGPS